MADTSPFLFIAFLAGTPLASPVDRPRVVCLRSPRESFRPEDREWIAPRRPPRRNVARGKRDDRQE